MQRKKYTIQINASKEKVWQVLWSDDSYPLWTSVFSEGSHAQSDWQEGSTIRFLSADGGGMYSIIAKKDDNRFMSFRHDGEIKNGVDQPLNDYTRKWSGVTENYTLSQDGDVTELLIELDLIESFESYFDEHFPKALQRVKELAEEGSER